MFNIESKIDGDILNLKIDLSKSNGESKSGKSKQIATTHGNVTLAHKSGAKMGINIYKPVTA